MAWRQNEETDFMTLLVPVRGGAMALSVIVELCAMGMTLQMYVHRLSEQMV